MKKPPAYLFTLLCAFLLLLSNLQAQDPGPPSGNGIQPEYVAGNPDCEDIGFTGVEDFSYKPQPEPPPTGDYPFPGDPINEISLVSDGTYFDWSSGIKLNAVIVKGGPNANVYYYNPEAYSDTDLHSPINPNNDQPYGISHIEVCYNYSLDIIVTDPPSTSYTRECEWTIDKDVLPSTWNLFNGDSGTSKYTLSVVPDCEDSGWAVEGTVEVENNTPLPATITGVSASISGVGAVALDCGVAFPHVLAPGETLSCSYGVPVPVPLPDGTDRVITAEVSTTGMVGGDESSEDIVFGDPSTEINTDINILDNFGGVDFSLLFSSSYDNPGIDNANWTHEYETTFSCNGDEGSLNNIAKVEGTDWSDEASVTINCYDLDVIKTAETSLTRTWTWGISKSASNVDENAEGVKELLLSEGQSFGVDYCIDLNASSEDSKWGVSGTIRITNNHPSRDADLTEVTDMISGGIAAEVTCPSLTVPAGEHIECSYSLATGTYLPDGTDRTNTATATSQNYNYSLDENGDETRGNDGTLDYSGTADVLFNQNTDVSKVDDQVSVSDPQAPVDPLGNVSASDQDVDCEFSYVYTVGPFNCVDGNPDPHENTAIFTTNTTGTTGSATETVNINLACGSGCTHTNGYWKTHSQEGPAPYDDNWANLGDIDGDGISEEEGEEFFGSGQTWYEVLWTPPAGNPYYILSRQYIAAYLNVLDGASTTSEVLDAMAWAHDFFSNNTPADADGMKGKGKKNLVRNAQVLDKYNNGEIGPGHCDDDAGTGGDGNRLGETLTFDEHLFIAYPNPAEHEIFIDISLLEATKGKLLMSDQLGRIVYQNKLSNLDDLILKIDLKQYNIKPGVYFISLENGKNKYTQKVMVISTD